MQQGNQRNTKKGWLMTWLMNWCPVASAENSKFMPKKDQQIDST